MIRFSANLGFLWPELPLIERIEAAARAGFRAIELHYPYATPPEQVRAACGRLGLRLLGINTDIGTGQAQHSGLAAVPGREADFLALIDQSVAWAVAAGATAIHAMAGIVPETRHAAGAETLVANLKLAAPRAAAHGLTLLLEPINQRNMPGFFYSTIEEADAIIERVGAPNIAIMFDAYHVGVSQGDIITRLRRYLPRIGHVQIAAVPSRAEPDEGEIAYGAIFSELQALGYAGWVGCEYRPRAGTDAGLVWLERLGVTL